MDKIIITKKPNKKGKGGFKTFSVRLREETVTELDKISKESNRSRNELINLFLSHAVKNWELGK